ncbi:MAG TPA: mercuric transporter MerT family protein [Nevskiales bacterium]|nr:mercuric transporter MerT family protein [Nevskiales bacterium]
MQDRSTLSLVASVVAGLGASVCCVLPLVLVMAGLGGSYLATFRAFEPYRPFFVAVALVALYFAYRGIFRKTEVCEPGQVCADPRVQRRRKTVFWAVAVLVVALLTFPYYAVLFV